MQRSRDFGKGKRVDLRLAVEKGRRLVEEDDFNTEIAIMAGRETSTA